MFTTPEQFTHFGNERMMCDAMHVILENVYLSQTARQAQDAGRGEAPGGAAEAG